jgi:hypothetical protein
MIEFREDQRVWHIWFVAGTGVDWLAIIFKNAGEGWTCMYRFRYYADDKAFDSQDRKSWTKLVTEDTSDEPPKTLVETISMVSRMTATNFGGEIHSLPVRGSGMRAFEMYKSQPWAHMKVVPAESVR